MSPRHYLIRYDEIALKGNNRSYFEKALLKDIRKRMKIAGLAGTVQNQRGRLFAELMPETDPAIFENLLSTVPGTVSYSPVVVLAKNNSAQGFDSFLTASKDIFNEIICDPELKAHSRSENKNQIRSFKIESRRSDKSYLYNSYEICCRTGNYMLENFPQLKVNVHTPDVTLHVEIREKIYLYASKFPGIGGLPIGTLGRTLLLLSGGIDSPVAAVRLSIRGLSCDFLHFHSYPYTSEEAKQKVLQLTRVLGKFNPEIRLYFLNFTNIQKKILAHAESALFSIIMRRTMLLIAQKFAYMRKIPALATGESLGQVSSQTLESIVCTDNAAAMPVFRPLIGMNKSEIITFARQYGTYDISIEPYEDCCTVFNPPNPATRPKLGHVLKEEARIPGLEQDIEEAVSLIEQISY